jgi:hypothetical protein
VKHTIRIFSLTLLLAGCFGLWTAAAADWYVDNAASAGGTGTSWRNAWNSFAAIRWGSGGVSAGDTLYISGGSSTKTYRERLEVPIAGTASKPITIRVGRDSGHDGLVVFEGSGKISIGILVNDYVRIEGRSASGGIGLKIRNMTQKGISANHQDAVSGVRISYVEIENCGTRSSGLKKPGYAHGIHIINAEDTEISYTHIYGSFKDGINLGGSKGTWGSNRVHHNHIHDNGDDGITGAYGMDVYDNLIHDQSNMEAGHPDGVQILGNYTRIYNNTIYNCANAQIFWDSLANGADAAHARIYNNLVYATDPGIGNYFRGIAIKAEKNTTGLSDLVIANNTVVDQGYFGIGIAANKRRMTNVTVVNNIVYNSGINSSYGITLYDYSTASDITVDYNLVHAGPSGDGQLRFGGAFRQAHPVTGEPSFLRYRQWAANNDFRLSSSSPAVGAGTEMRSLFSTDMTGLRRSRWDLGSIALGSGGPAGAGPVGNVSGGLAEPGAGGDSGGPSAPKGFRLR